MKSKGRLRGESYKHINELTLSATCTLITVADCGDGQFNTMVAEPYNTNGGKELRTGVCNADIFYHHVVVAD